MEKKGLTEYFEGVETTEEYDGYYYRVSEAVTISILGSICGLRNGKQIWQWAAHERTREFLKEKFQIERVPCYYWLLCLLKMIKPESLNKCFVQWVKERLPEKVEALTLSLDGKTIRSTGKKARFETPLHIVSAHIAELGLTFAQKAVDSKSNEIPAVRELLRELDISGCLVVADALNCQKETAKTIVKGGGDYLLDVKGNQPELMQDIQDYIQDDTLRGEMDTATTKEMNGGRFEVRTAYATDDVSWLSGSDKWEKLACIGAIHTEFETNSKKTSEWHYYISSRPLTAQELLHHARMEWSVESMHWLLDVHFNEDYCQMENRNIQQNLNMARKMALNIIRSYKLSAASKRPISNIMFDCLLDPLFIANLLL